MKLELYTVKEEYFNYLREVEEKVPFIKKQRPFLGTVLSVHGKNYIVPLSSPKEKHKKIDQTVDLIKIKNGDWGVLNLNNMIPIPRSQYHKMQIETVLDTKYQKLLQYQIAWCNRHQEEIIQKATNLYQQICEEGKLDNSLKQRCCNFKVLEQRCHDYMKENRLNEEELSYLVC